MSIMLALQIHTSKMTENSFLAQDVDLAELAGLFLFLSCSIVHIPRLAFRAANLLME